MKRKAVLVVFIFILNVACKHKESKMQKLINDTVKDTASLTTVEWKDTLIHFGSIKQGQKVKIQFYCKNTGNKPLILLNVNPTCGCTIASYTKEPILPGAEGLVNAEFNSGHFCGEIHKAIIAVTNTKHKLLNKLLFTGIVTDCNNSDKTVVPNKASAKKDMF